jgi:hypothetical protein
MGGLERNFTTKEMISIFPICFYAIPYFKLNGIDAINEITKHKVI